MVVLGIADKAHAKANRRTSIVRGSRRANAASHGPKARRKAKGKDKGNDDAGYDDGAYDDITGDNIFDNVPTVEILNGDSFVAYCRSSLLSFGYASDGLISQVDVTEFIWDLCDIFDPDDLPAFRCPTPQFSNLDVAVQLSFVWYICPHEDQASTLTCLGNLGIQEEEFGYPILPDNYQSTSERITGFCCSLLSFLDQTDINPLSSTVCPEVLPRFDLDSTLFPVTEGTVFPTTSPPALRPSPAPAPSPAIVSDGDNSSSGSSATPTPTGDPVASTNPPTSGEQTVAAVRGSQGGQAATPATPLSTGGTVGIVLGSAAALIAFALLFSRRRRKADDYAGSMSPLT